MKKAILSGAILALILSGCSDSPKPQVDESTEEVKQVKEVAPVETETVSAENGNVINEDVTSSADSNEMNMASLESELVSAYFAFDKYDITSETRENISANASVANGNASAFMIKLEGNCDEWGSDEYNFALGLKRADAVKKALVSEGVDANRITMVSYGESNPVCNDKTRECWAKNRRVDYKLLP